MSTSFIDYKENGFWIDDDILAITVGFIYKTLSEEKDKSEWMVEMQESFRQNGQGFFRGFADLELDNFLINDERKEKIHQIIEDTRILIVNKGDIIDVEELNNFLFDGELEDVWVGKIEALRILKVLDYLVLLINEKIETKASDPIDYFF
jgi:hypothetical protein